MNKLTDQQDQELRDAVGAYWRALSDQSIATDKVHKIVGEQVRFHGAEAVVKWMLASPSLPRPGLEFLPPEDFLMTVMRLLPGRGRKGSLIQILCDAEMALRKEVSK